MGGIDRNIINMFEQTMVAIDNIEESNSNNIEDDFFLLYKLHVKMILQDLLKEYLDYTLPEYRLKQEEELKRLSREMRVSLNI